MSLKILSIILSGLLLVGGIAGVGLYLDEEPVETPLIKEPVHIVNLETSTDTYDVTALLDGLEEAYDEKFMLYDAEVSGGSGLGHSHNFYSICSEEDTDCRFSIESIVDGDKKDIIAFTEREALGYGVIKASNELNKYIKENSNTLLVLPEDNSFVNPTDFDKNLLENKVYLSEPVKYINGFRNGEYEATFLYSKDYDREKAFKEIIPFLYNSGLNRLSVDIAFVTDEEYQMFKEQFDNFEYPYVRSEEYDIDARGDVFTFYIRDNKLDLYNTETYEKIDFGDWLFN